MRCSGVEVERSKAVVLRARSLAPLVKARGFGMTQRFLVKSTGLRDDTLPFAKRAWLARQSVFGENRVNSAVVSATETARLGVGARGAQSGIGKVHPMLNTHSDQIALAAGMRPIVINHWGQRLLR